ncbi:aminopeptidase N [Arsukibacterium tuosuense]|uniref:Aminopeptidase N n=1 Tax=Arsukibacterium tuosuense TaxID=1323745 RepID=A0A285I2D7_9GAMM|nr:aminopeptidase N [Arsukibacterium tuosuense]SNY42135.1 aminopeptidase N [Arsukibacterium tuosuense]
MSSNSARSSRRLADYRQPDFLIPEIELSFELDPDATRVTALMQVKRQTEGAPLILDGQHLDLHYIALDGVELRAEQYQITDDQLIIARVPAEFSLQITTGVNPAANTALEGLYLANNVFCTQCEAEGFRRIMYFPDRPDVLTIYTTHIIADQNHYPYLLANGNKTASETLADGRTRVSWHDPFAKPCYLFALVAGKFDCLNDSFTTQSGRVVALQLFVEPGQLEKGHFAMAALKRAMRWDETRYNLEYDLDVYMVVAVDFFNMGAMENKGLNVFNSKYVLADDSIATDKDYFNIESIIGHEYFHNWTGNRVTCRDWFQLSLKEGLTVFRDQEFSADMGSATLNRIDAVKLIRTAQFAEDAGPMAHPIRPEQVLEMNNFYTVTVYDKGAEVIRMLQTLLGKPGFNRGLACYLQRHDGQAVTCDDFVSAMEEANDVDLNQFRLWYSQAGTPLVTLNQRYDAKHATLHLEICQHHSASADQPDKQSLLIPLQIQLLSSDGQVDQQHLITLSQFTEQFSFTGVTSEPVVIWENFSAPVKMQQDYQLGQLLLIAEKATNGFARWDAMQVFWSNLIRQHARKPDDQLELPEALLDVMRHWLQQPLSDLALTAELLSLPDFDTLAEQYDQIPVDVIISGLQSIRQQLAELLEQDWQLCYQTTDSAPYHYSEQAVGARALRNRCLSYLALTSQGTERLEQHYKHADNMTDTMAALAAAQDAGSAGFASLAADFADKWQDNVLVMDKYFSLLACDPSSEVFNNLTKLSAHPLFSWKNPNRVRALFGAFSMRNPEQFHRADGQGYRCLAEVVARMDAINPQVAARLITPLLAWQRFNDQRRENMLAELKQLATKSDLSNDLYEKISKSLS